MMNEREVLRARYQPKRISTLNPDLQLTTVRFSPCGRFLAACGFHGRVHRWMLPTPTEGVATAEGAAEEQSSQSLPSSTEPVALEPLAAHSGWLSTFAFHPHGELLYSADSWGRLCAWRYADENPQPLWAIDTAHDGWIRDLHVSPDGALVATAGVDRKVRLWSAADGAARNELSGHEGDLFSVRFHPNGQWLVSGDVQGCIKVWSLNDAEPTREIDARVLYKHDRLQEVGGARCLRFSRDGATLAAAGTLPKQGGNVLGVPAILLFDWTTGELQRTLKLGAERDVYTCDLDFHPEGFLMAVTSGEPGSGGFLFQRVEDDAPFFTTKQIPNCHSLSLHPDGKQIAVSATNKVKSRNKRLLGKDGEYLGITSPIYFFELPEAES